MENGKSIRDEFVEVKLLFYLNLDDSIKKFPCLVCLQKKCLFGLFIPTYIVADWRILSSAYCDICQQNVTSMLKYVFYDSHID